MYTMLPIYIGKVLCILTSEQVLLMPFTEPNHLFLAFSHFLHKEKMSYLLSFNTQSKSPGKLVAPS